MLCRENVILEKKYDLRCYDFDVQQKIKPSTILNLAQALATTSADDLGFGFDEVVANNCVWVLLKSHVEIYDYPGYIDNLTIKTEPRGYSKLFVYRDFEFSHEGKKIIRMSTTWTLMNFETKSIRNVREVFPEMFPIEKREDDLQYEKIPPLSKVDFEKSFEVRFEELDMNRHVNNVNYVIWALETLDFDFKNEHTVKKMEIVYKKELKYGATVLVQTDFDKENFISNHIVKCGDDIIGLHRTEE